MTPTVDEFTDGWIDDLLEMPPDATPTEWKQAVERLWWEAEDRGRKLRDAHLLLALLVKRAGGRIMLEDAAVLAMDRKQTLVTYRDEIRSATIYEVKV